MYRGCQQPDNLLSVTYEEYRNATPTERRPLIAGVSNWRQSHITCDYFELFIKKESYLELAQQLLESDQVDTVKEREYVT